MGKLIRIFSAPNDVFESEKESPNPWLPFIAVIVVVLIVVLVTGLLLRGVWIEKAAERVKELPPEQRESAMKMLQPGRMIATGVVYALIGMPLKMLITALVYLILVPLVGSISSFLFALTAVAYANVISLLALIIKAPIEIITKNPQVQTSFALFLQGLDHRGFIYRFATQADFFTFWSLYVLGIGLAIMGGFSKKKGVLLTYVVWFLWTLIYVSMQRFIPRGVG